MQIQICTALTAMMALRYLQLRSTFPWSLSNLVALLRQPLFVYRGLWTWLNHPFQAPGARRSGAANAAVGCRWLIGTATC